MWKIITAVASFFCLMIIAIGILLANAKRGTDVPLEIAKGLISLEVAILITGVLSYFLSERVRKQAEKAEKDREVQAHAGKGGATAG